jgi:hypothetical protein
MNMKRVQNTENKKVQFVTDEEADELIEKGLAILYLEPDLNENMNYNQRMMKAGRGRHYGNKVKRANHSSKN